MQTATQGTAAGSSGVLRFTLTLGAWFVGLFGLMRLGWVERNLLTPFAQLQQGVADQLTGAPSDLVYADASCSGGDPIALCVGAICAFPAAWSSRLRGAALGVAAITALNVVRLGTLSLVAADPALLDVLHVYVWPGILILASAAWVYGWMGRQGRDGGADTAAGAGAIADAAAATGPGPAVLGGAARRFLLLAAVLVTVYFATAPFFYESPAVDVVAGWIAATGGVILGAAGTAVRVAGPVIRTTHGGFVVTQECIFTPLIPLYLAGALAAPLTPLRRAAALAATPAIFFAVGVSRLLVLAVPAAVVGSYEVAIHAFSQTLVAILLVAGAAAWTADGGRRAAQQALGAVGAGLAAAFAAAPLWGALVGGGVALVQNAAGHAGHLFADEQGAAAILPAFQIGLFAALWVAVAGRAEWRRAALGLGILVAAQAVLYLQVGELAHHYGFDPHVGLIRGWAIALPVFLVWRLAPAAWRVSAAAWPTPQPGWRHRGVQSAG